MNKNNFFVWRKDADHCPKPFLQQSEFLWQASVPRLPESADFLWEGGGALFHYIVQIWKRYINK